MKFDLGGGTFGVSILEVEDGIYEVISKSFGTFRLDGNPSAPRGVPQVQVSFESDKNGILSVTARDSESSKEDPSPSVEHQPVVRMK